MQNAEVIFSTLPGKGGDIGEIKLNRPASLNALNLFMCVAIKEQLQQWEKNPQIKGIIIKAEGEKAFCAGGDIRSVYQWHKQEGDVEQALNFFSQEYQLNFLIFHCSKPYIAFLDGLTLGGGQEFLCMDHIHWRANVLLLVCQKHPLDFFQMWAWVIT